MIYIILLAIVVAVVGAVFTFGYSALILVGLAATAAILLTLILLTSQGGLV